MGITQHENGVANVQSIANFALLRGQIGRRGAGLCPVRGHSNVQGDRTVGIWEKMSPAFLQALGREFGFSPPDKHGLDTVKTIEAMHDGRVKVFVGLGGNFLSATPDTHYTSEAMARCRLTVQISTKLNRGHLITGAAALILPVPRADRARRAEVGRAVRDRRGHDRRRPPVARRARRPASEHLLQRAGDRRPGWRWPRSARGAPSTGRASSTTTIASATTSSTSSPASSSTTAASASRAASTCRTARARGSSRRRRGGRASPSTRIPVHALGDGRLLLTTLRSHDQFNTTIYGENDRYRGIHGGRRVVFLNADDMRERGIEREPDRRSGEPLRRRAPPRRALQGGPLRDPARLRRRLLPRDERARSGGGRRRGQQPAGLEVDRRSPSSRAAAADRALRSWKGVRLAKALPRGLFPGPANLA